MTAIAALSLFVGVSGVIGSAAVVTDGIGLTRVGSVTGAPTVGTTSAPPPGIDPKVVLIDGRRLAELMIDFEVGVSTARTYQVKRIDSDYFEEG